MQLLQDVHLGVIVDEVQDPRVAQYGRSRGGWGNSSGRARARSLSLIQEWASGAYR